MSEAETAILATLIVPESALTAVCAVIGRLDLDDLMSDRDAVELDLGDSITPVAAGPWGARIERVRFEDLPLRTGGRPLAEITPVRYVPRRPAVVGPVTRSPMDC
jgi:hypothetical protein